MQSRSISMPPKFSAAVVAQAFVVIAGNEDDARALARLAQQLLQHVVVGLRPVRAAAHFPEVDDVADEIDRLGTPTRLQEIEQRFGLRRARPKMDVRDEYRSVAELIFVQVVHRPSPSHR